MAFYDWLIAETAAERTAFMSLPLIRQAVQKGVSRTTYLAFLGQAYHHVHHTCPLMQRAASRCVGAGDAVYKSALAAYIAEETGHDAWILEDIAAMGGDPQAVRQSEPDVCCRRLIHYAYYTIDEISPYALMGMVHVLEGMSAALAGQAAETIRTNLGGSDAAGFRYLTSHGCLDQEHVAFFQTLVNGFTDRTVQNAIVSTSRAVYGLYGDIFQSLESEDAA